MTSVRTSSARAITRTERERACRGVRRGDASRTINGEYRT
jgi:hypothetical protein